MLQYYWLTYKYFGYVSIDPKENVEIVDYEEAFVPHWKYLTQIDFNNSNFFFLTENCYNYNTISLINTSYISTKIDFFDEEREEERALLPIVEEEFFFVNNFSNEFVYLKKSSFINFFMSNMIDVPICFKKSKSLRTKNFELPILKFSNFLMWEGKKKKIIILIFKVMRALLESFKNEKTEIKELVTPWIHYYLTTTAVFYFLYKTPSLKWIFNKEKSSELLYGNFLIDDEKNININFFVKNYLIALLSKVSPIFSYFIYSVDKNIRKFSRGKSGKYVFVWKYIASYKRINLAIRWIVKDIRFYQSKKFDERIEKTLKNLIINFNKSFAWKSKIFSHNYVFKNFRKSLMSSLKTIS